MITLTVNGRKHDVDVDPDTPLLWVLRDDARPDRHQVRLRRRAVRRLHRACRRRARCARAARRSSGVAGQSVVTIEGVQGKAARAVQAAWERLDVPQCGYCQSGQIMSAVAPARRRTPKPSDGDIDARDGRQHLPLRHLSSHPRRDPRRGQDDGGLSHDARISPRRHDQPPPIPAGAAPPAAPRSSSDSTGPAGRMKTAAAQAAGDASRRTPSCASAATTPSR